ncbi:MAG: cellulose synthase complex periplasmic endoglucanase BcsZ [Candidatus Acidiferrum sp.]
MKLLCRASVVAALLLSVCARQSQGTVSLFDAWPLWESYKARFVSEDGRVIDWHSNGRTTSEGQAYALFFSLVANDRPTFRTVLQWTEVNLAQGSLKQKLPAWLWEKEPGNPGRVKDWNSASDADLWIAYTLIFAGRDWNNPEYESLGSSLAERIAREEVVVFSSDGSMLMPGREGFRPDPHTYIFNPSYLPPQVLLGLSTESPHGPWKQIANNLPNLLARNVGNGFAMDWVEYQPKTGFRATALAKGSPGGSYDAIRVYLWFGMLDHQTEGYETLLQLLSGMTQYMRAHSLPPECVSPSGVIISDPSPVGFSAAIIPFLLAAGETRAANEQQARLKKEFSEVSGLYGKEPSYYDQNLALFADGWSNDHYRFDANGRLWLSWRKK